jgi:hypothetical protein
MSGQKVLFIIHDVIFACETLIDIVSNGGTIFDYTISTNVMAEKSSVICMFPGYMNTTIGQINFP